MSEKKVHVILMALESGRKSMIFTSDSYINNNIGDEALLEYCKDFRHKHHPSNTDEVLSARMLDKYTFCMECARYVRGTRSESAKCLVHPQQICCGFKRSLRGVCPEFAPTDLFYANKAKFRNQY